MNREAKIETAASNIAYGLYHLLMPERTLQQYSQAASMLKHGLEVALDLLAPKNPAT